MLTWKVNWSPLRVHLDFQVDMATVLFWAIQNLEIQPVIAKGPLGLPSNHCDFSILNDAEWSTRAHRRVTMVTRVRARAWGFLSPQDREHTQKHTLTGKSNRSPLRVHLDFQANMTTLRLRTIQKLYEHAQADDHGNPCAIAHAGLSVLPTVENVHKNPKLTWKSNRLPRRFHLDFQASMATFRL